MARLTRTIPACECVDNVMPSLTRLPIDFVDLESRFLAVESVAATLRMIIDSPEFADCEDATNSVSLMAVILDRECELMRRIARCE